MSNSTASVSWMPSNSDRGSLDILWSCCLTIALCVWVSTHPNVPSPKDKWYHEVIDRLNLACIGLLGPDYLFALAGGQLFNARRSLKKFNAHPEILQGRDWSLTHAFFADMGGFILASPDYPDGFPIDAEQLFYLVQHQHVDFPALTNDDIRDRNKSDSLTKLLTLGQVSFFLVNEFWRIGQGYPITTLELTTITFSFLMMGTSVGWYFKPVISSATVLRTRDNRTILDIRRTARTSTHPELQHTWYRTPLAFLSRHNFHFDRHWAYYSNVSFRLHLPLFGREVTATPWDRIPGDIWYPLEWGHPDVYLIALGLLVQVPFCVSFLGAWFFAFPTRAEHVIWRVCAIYHAAYSLIGTFYFTYISYRDRNGQRSLLPKVSPHHEMISYPVTRVPSSTQEPIGSDNTELGGRLPRSMTNLKTWAASLRNISPDQDPDMEIPLRWTSAFFFPTVLYIFCRLYFYIEDLISLRSQPAGVYSSVERIFPFI